MPGGDFAKIFTASAAAVSGRYLVQISPLALNLVKSY
jgi:hypothetical protein